MRSPRRRKSDAATSDFLKHRQNFIKKLVAADVRELISSTLSSKRGNLYKFLAFARKNNLQLDKTAGIAVATMQYKGLFKS